jgi:hypothetical protein
MKANHLTAQIATLRLTLESVNETEYPYNFLTNTLPYYAENEGFGANGETRLYNALDNDTLFYDHDGNEYTVSIPSVLIEVFADRNETRLIRAVDVPTALLIYYRDANPDKRLTGEDVLSLLDTFFGGLTRKSFLSVPQLETAA